ncbi:heparan-sulfate 6-O-sulfotransferase 2 isoform X2 [Larus michahellis]|uniref:heparan-sulfate 6-O-sulfotransferase 2 isoform X2 n=1 Tax=Larus michahellis TaxID=119627 RepID=UPI003D9B8E2C
MNLKCTLQLQIGILLKAEHAVHGKFCLPQGINYSCPLSGSFFFFFFGFCFFLRWASQTFRPSFAKLSLPAPRFHACCESFASVRTARWSPAFCEIVNFYYITILRDPVSRYLSEWRHVQRGATWKASLHVCDGRSPTTEELPSCYTGDDWSGCSLQEFMDCPYNLANNRQVRMLSDLSLVGCYNLSVMPEEQRNKVLLDSAKENLKRMAFFGLTEFQRKTQYLFEKTFNMNFISPFTQYNSTRASSVEIDEQTQQRIEALNFLDVELYDYAKDLFLQRYQYMRQKEHQEARRKRQEQRKILRAKQAHLREQGDNSSSTDYIGNVERWRR